MNLVEEERNRILERNSGYSVEVRRWVLDKDANLAFVQDNDGMNRDKSRKAVGTGLERLAEVVPQWPRFREDSNGLHPHMLAATMGLDDHDHDEKAHPTAYELLRFVGSVHP